MLVLIAISIVIYGSKNDIYPLVYVKFSTNVLVIIKVYWIRAEILKADQLDLSCFFCDSSGYLYPSSITPHVSRLFTSSFLQHSHACGSMMVSLFVSPNSGRENVTSWFFILISTDIFVRNLTRSFSTMIRFLCLSIRPCAECMCGWSPIPLRYRNFHLHLQIFQQPVTEKWRQAECREEIALLRSLYTTISSKHSLSFSTMLISSC